MYKKLLLAILLSLSLISCIKKPEDNSYILYKSTVYVSIEEDAPGTVEKTIPLGHGSGIIIKHLGSDYWILTAGHVAEDAIFNKALILIGFNKNYKADIVKVDHSKDLALLHITAVEDLQRAISPVCSTAPKELDEVISTGFPGAYSEVISKGMMVTPAYAVPNPDDPNLLLPEALHTTLTGPGYSGGGLYEQQEGQYCLIGINSMGSTVYPQISFAVSYWAIKDFLKGVI